MPINKNPPSLPDLRDLAFLPNNVKKANRKLKPKRFKGCSSKNNQTLNKWIRVTLKGLQEQKRAYPLCLYISVKEGNLRVFFVTAGNSERFQNLLLE